MTNLKHKHRNWSTGGEKGHWSSQLPRLTTAFQKGKCMLGQRCTLSSCVVGDISFQMDIFGMDALTIKSLMPGIILQSNKPMIGCLHYKHAGDTWATQVSTVRVFFLKNLLKTKCFITVGGWLNPQMRNCRYGKPTAKLHRDFWLLGQWTHLTCEVQMSKLVWLKGQLYFPKQKELVGRVSLPAVLQMSLKPGLIKGNWIIIWTLHSNCSNKWSFGKLNNNKKNLVKIVLTWYSPWKYFLVTPNIP